MDIKLEYYKIFFHVAKHLSFSNGAKELYMTQSAVSQSVQNLERALEVTLFLRNSKGVSLTAEGELLYAYVEQALSLVQKGESEIQKIKTMELGDLRIGVGDTISRYLLLPFLEQFHKKHPKIKLQIFNRTSYDTISLLKSGKIDLAFVNLPLTQEGIETRQWQEVHDVFVAGQHFSHLKNKVLSLAELNTMPLILLERTANSRQYVERFFLSHGLVLHPEIELGSHDLLLEFAKINLGISCVSKEFSHGYLENNSLFQLKLATEIPKRSVGVCTLKGVSTSIAANVFLTMIDI